MQGTLRESDFHPQYSVLVIERGGSPYGDPDIKNADAYGKVLRETYNYTSP